MRFIALVALCAVAVSAAMPTTVDVREFRKAPSQLSAAMHAAHREVLAANALVQARRTAFHQQQSNSTTTTAAPASSTTGSTTGAPTSSTTGSAASGSYALPTSNYSYGGSTGGNYSGYGSGFAYSFGGNGSTFGTASSGFGGFGASAAASGNASGSLGFVVEPLSQCEANYLNALQAASNACPQALTNNIFNIIMLDPGNTTGVQQAIGWCNNSCLQGIYKVVANYTGCNTPLAKSIEYGINSVQLSCSQDQFGGYCFQTFGRVINWGMCSSYTTAATCNAVSVCNFANGVCNEVVSTPVLSNFCQNTCIFDFVSFLFAYNDPSAAIVSSALDYTCMQSSGTYCVQAFNDVALTGTESYKQLAAKFCANSTRAGCLRLYGSITVAKMVQGATQNFQQCANKSKSQLSKSLINGCLKQLNNDLQSADDTDISNQFTCATVDNTPTGAYCGSVLFENLFVDKVFMACWGTALNGKACTTACDTKMTTEFKNAGCCAYYFGQFSSRPIEEDALIPDIPGGPNTTTWSFKAAGIPDIQPFAEFSKCSMTKANATAGSYARCVAAASSRQQAVTAVAKTLELQVAYQAFASEARRKERLRLALRKDIAAAIGATEAAIISDSVVENTARQVTLRKNKQTTYKVNAARYLFSIKDSTANLTATESNTFDSKNTAGQLTTPTANNLVRPSNCKSCLDEYSSSVVMRPLQAQAAAGQPVPTRKGAPGAPPVTTKKVASQATTAAPGTPGAKKSSAPATAALAAVLAVLAALAF